MMQAHTQTSNGQTRIDSANALEARLRELFAKQRRLRELLDQTRSELDSVNQDVLSVQAEYCTDAQREEEYLQVLERLLGLDPRIRPEELQGAVDAREFLEGLFQELEQEAGQGMARKAG